MHTTNHNKVVMGFMLSNLHLISLFNRIISFKFEGHVFTVTVHCENDNKDGDMEWDHFKRSCDEAKSIGFVKNFNIETTPHHTMTATVTFNQEKSRKKSAAKK